MIDPDLQTYRLAIGMFSFGAKRKQKANDFKCDEDANALCLALLCTLLVIGGLKLNPDPSTADEYHQPGPSFLDGTPIDVLQSIRIVHPQLEQLSLQV